MSRTNVVQRLRELQRLAERQGWEVTRTGGRHLRFRPPDRAQAIVIVGYSPSASGLRDAEAQLRKSGLDIGR